MQLQRGQKLLMTPARGLATDLMMAYTYVYANSVEMTHAADS